MEVERKTPVDQVKLPRSGSKLQRTLREVAREAPDAISTQAVAQAVVDESADVSSRLMVLANKGLIDRVHAGQGSRGGSTWRLSKLGQRLLHSA